MEPFIRTGFRQSEGGTILVRLASRAVVCLLGSLVAGLPSRFMRRSRQGGRESNLQVIPLYTLSL